MKKSPLQIVGIQRPKNYKKVIDPNSGQGVKENILRAPKVKVKEPQVYNMTPNVSEEEAKKVRDKFDETYMKGRGKVNETEPHADSEWENATYQLMNEGKISESDNKAYPLIEARVKANTSKSSDSPLHGAYSEGKGMHGAVTGTDSDGNTIEFGNVDLGGTAEDESAWRDSTQNLFNSVMAAFDKTEWIENKDYISEEEAKKIRTDSSHSYWDTKKYDPEFKRSENQKKKGDRKYNPSSGSIQRVPCKDGGYRVWDEANNEWTCK